MRTIPANIQSKIDDGTFQAGWLWKIKRSDGVIKAYNRHDVDIELDLGDGDGLVMYKAGPLEDHSQYASTQGTEVDETSLDGLTTVLSGFGIEKDDLIKGLYDAALVTVGVCHLPDPSLGGFIFMRPITGDIAVIDNKWQMKTRSLISLMDVRVGRKVQKECGWVFGSVECGYDLSSSTHTATVVEVVDSRRIKVSVSQPADYFRHGNMYVTTGRNSGLKMKILNNGQGSADEIEMLNPPPFNFTIGDSMDLVQGCDRTGTQCDIYGRSLSHGGFRRVAGQKIRGQVGTRTE